VYTPNDVGVYTMEQVDKRVAAKPFALRTRVPVLDAGLRPLMPGEVVFVTAYTANGKTAFMQFWARQIVAQLVERPNDSEIAVYVSWETLVEELGMYDLCGMTGIDTDAAWHGEATRDEVEALRMAAAKRATMPLWVLGYSLKRRRQEGGLTLAAVSDGLQRVESAYGLRPAIIFLDYLQIITPDNAREDRRMQVMRNVDMIQTLARDCGAPVVVGCQAGRQVLERAFALPEIGDGQETSRIEQDADKVLALWYPCKTRSAGARIEELNVEVTDRLMVFGIRKQRHAPSGQVMLLDFDAAHNTFAGWDGGNVDEDIRY